MGYELITSTVVAWFLAQAIKSAINSVNAGKLDLSCFFGSGGMPSSHSAAVVAFSISCLLNYGFNSYQFAVSFLLAGIVLYDACGIRYEGGRHAKAINEIHQILRRYPANGGEKKLKETLGHTGFQVFSGSVLGVIVSVIINLLFK